MASGQTEKYGLNQWEPDDQVLREEFNADNRKLEAAIGTKLEAVAGSYAGNASSTGSQEIVLGFRPKFVMVWVNTTVTSSSMDNLGSGMAMATDGDPYGEILTITDTGFTAASTATTGGTTRYPRINTSGITYHYVALW